MKVSMLNKIILISSLIWSFQTFAQGKAERLGKVARMDLVQRVTIAGNVEPERKTIVTAPFNGYVKKIYVKMGQKVKKGDPLVSVTQSLQSIDPVYPLRAPFDGTVVAIQRYEGEFVKRDDPRDFILRIDSLDKLYILSDVPEIDSVKIKKGQKAIIKATAILDKRYEGVVEEVSLASKYQDSWRGKSKVEYPARILITKHDKDIKPGMSTILDIVTFKKDNVLTLPHEFILKEKNDFFVVDKEGKRKKIQVGLQNESFFEVISGLNEGEEVRQVDFLELFSGGKK